MKPRILIVDDEPEIVTFMADALSDVGYDVLVAYDGPTVFERLSSKPDLIILDVMMPGMDGFEVCRAIRDRVACPILFLSARREETDRIQGLLVGGDDYMVKPFAIAELKARVQAHLRREQRTTGSNKGRSVIYDGVFALDADNYSVYIRDKQIPLTAKEFEVVRFLLSHPTQVFSREHIYERVWGLDADGDAATVTEHIKKIRAKFARVEPDRTFVATVWGVGYKWERERP